MPLNIRPHIAVAILFILTLFAGVDTPAAAQTADSYIVVDAGSGRVLNAMNPDAQLFPASMTKIMTLFMTFEALSQGRLSLRTMLPVSDLAAEQAPSKLGLHAGSRISVEDCIYGAVTLSANDCAVVLAEGIGGSEDEFARMMTSRAHSLGMVNTHFNNANGLPDEGQLTTARDMATLAEAMIQRFPKYYPYFRTRSFTYNGITHANHNHLMSRYPGMDGIKTGYIRASGFNLTASAVQNGHRLIAVIFGGTSAVARDNYMASLLDDGFRRVAGQPVPLALHTQPMATALPSTNTAPKPPAQVNIVQTDHSKTGQVAGIDLSEAGDEVDAGEGAMGAPSAPLPPATPQAAGPMAVAGPDQQTVAVIAPLPTTPAAPSPETKPAAPPIAEGPISLPEAALTQPVPQSLATATALPAKPQTEAEKTINDVMAEGDADIAEPAPEHVLKVPLKKASLTVPAVPKAKKWAVQIGTFSSKASSDALLQKAVVALPHDIRAEATPVSQPVTIHHKKIYRAQLTGFTELGAKKACSVLAHCMTVKS